MSHEIIKPIDEVFSLAGAEWHGLADAPLQSDEGTIGENSVKRLCPDIREMRVVGEIDGKTIELKQYKALVADYRSARPELTEGSEFAFVPLHIPKSGYKVISNCEVFEACKIAMVQCGIDAKIVTAGTLGAGRRFFISVDIRGESQIKVGNAEYLAFLNFITSHDGTLAARAYDSTVKIVCQNTLNWSLQASGDVGFCVYHNQNASIQMSNMGALVASILQGRKGFVAQMEALAAIPMSAKEALQVAASYFVQGQSSGSETLNYELSTKSLNACDEIVHLFSHGAGNEGKSALDLLNGATDYWSNGSGTGKSANKLVKVGKALFGSASEHKSEFASHLFGADFASLCETGEKALSIAKE